MLRDSVVRTRPRPLAMIIMRKSFIWLWGSAWWSFGPPELRLKQYLAPSVSGNVYRLAPKILECSGALKKMIACNEELIFQAFVT